MFIHYMHECADYLLTLVSALFVFNFISSIQIVKIIFIMKKIVIISIFMFLTFLTVNVNSQIDPPGVDTGYTKQGFSYLCNIWHMQLDCVEVGHDPCTIDC